MFIVVFLIVAFIIPINNKYPNNEGSGSLNNNNSYDNPIDIQYELISKKVIPYIVNAKVTIDNESYVGEVIQDTGNGKEYCIEINNEEKWYSKYYVTILDVNELILDKGTHFYSRDNTYICYNYLKYSGSYLLHSFPYSLDKKVLDDRLYDRVSNGCVRLTFEDSLYLYNDIPINSTIWLN